MNHLSESFTLEHQSLVNVLKTKCGVCRAFDSSIEKNHPNIETFIGLWDTGATNTVISKECAAKLDLKSMGQTKVYHANGEAIVNSYMINLWLPNNVGFSFVEVTEGELAGTDLLIGMDIISQGDFSISNFEGKTTFSFRVPSIRKIDFVADHHQHQKKPVLKEKSIGRNEKCPCGRDKKFKHCCGKK